MSRLLVTGGVRCGKSRYAQSRVGVSGDQVTYVAAGPHYDDADWAARVAAHRRDRPSSWDTVEPVAPEVPRVIAQATGPVIVECLGTWLTAVLDELGAWEGPRSTWQGECARLTTELTAAVAGARHQVVLVSNEVGWGLVSEHRSGRIFADELGRLNQQVAQVCDEVVLVVAGQPLTLRGPGS